MDISNLKFDGSEDAVVHIKARKAFSGDYLRGPIPMVWLRKASSLSGSALAVGLALWQLRSMRKNITFSTGIGDIAGRWGLHPDTVRRAMQALRDAKLINIEEKAGCKNKITLVS